MAKKGYDLLGRLKGTHKDLGVLDPQVNHSQDDRNPGTALQNAVTEDVKNWSGGLEPGEMTDEDMENYIDFSIPQRYDSIGTRNWLRKQSRKGR